MRNSRVNVSMCVFVKRVSMRGINFVWVVSLCIIVQKFPVEKFEVASGSLQSNKSISYWYEKENS